MKPVQGYTSYNEMFKQLAQQYADMPIDNVISAFGRASGSSGFTANPYVQNRRVKSISSLPVEYSYDKVGEMIAKPNENEQPLRQVSHVLESTVAPYWKIRKTYQDVLTYHWYVYPAGETRKEDAEAKDFKRELRLAEKIVESARIQQKAHEIVGQCVEEGKVFYVPRYEVDKTHNNVNYAFLQQLPQDWVKIVGYNNISKYTVAFNLMYFMEPGTSAEFYGDLFRPFMEDFWDVAVSLPKKNKNRKFVYAQDDYTGKIKRASGNSAVDIYYDCGRWYYWVILPIDKVWCFEIDDVNRNVVPPLTGLFLSLVNIAKYEQIQISLVQNPLISIMTGEIPYRDDPAAATDDAYRLSPAGRKLFESYWYQMLAETNTTGVGVYFAPVENLKLQQMAEAPSATQISSNGYTYAMQKSGIGIIPYTTDPRAGTVKVSLQIESKFGEPIYRQMENMMNYIFFDIGLKYDWRFRMFGNLAEDENTLKTAKDGMTLGVLSSTLEYLAILGRRITDDYAASAMIMGSGIMDMRQPLVSSYSARADQQGTTYTGTRRRRRRTDGVVQETGYVEDRGGRPRNEQVGSEGNEQDIDQGK